MLCLAACGRLGYEPVADAPDALRLDAAANSCQVGCGFTWGATWSLRAGVNTLLSNKYPGVQRFRVGILAPPPQGAVSFWFDDWAITSTYIGCY